MALPASQKIPREANHPQHVAIIMDGNGRWALNRQLPRIEGHREGAKIVRDITTYCRELGISHLTLYSFSIQNWKRPVQEINGLMNLLEEYCVKDRDTLMDNHIRFNTIGDLLSLPQTTQNAVNQLTNETKTNTKMTLTLALNYGSREEIIHAMQNVYNEALAKNWQAEDLTEKVLAEKLFTKDLPDPDLIIRTSGEYRISNFLLWQMAYAELHFTETLWPDFSRAHFDTALNDYANRQRRFGDVDIQLASSSGL